MKDINVPFASASFVFNKKTLPEEFKKTRKLFPQLDSLPPESQAALVSLVYNRGTGMKGDRKLEMREIQDALQKGELDEVPNLIEKMGRRLWPESHDYNPNTKKGSKTSKGLRQRRFDEAEKFRKGLKLKRN